jgi:hypothetical protein
MFATDVRAAAETWRPQRFGDRRVQDVPDPIVEPLWNGLRVLALVDDDGVWISDADGHEIDGHEEIRPALVDAARGTSILIDGYLTPEPIQPITEVAAREATPVPQAGEMLTHLVFGQRRSRSRRLVELAEESRRRSEAIAGVDVALVAVDLLWVDSEALLDVPLLERKRILESVLTESNLIRIGIHIRPPIDVWLGSWRAFGFRRIAFKAANSRYLPGEKNAQWAQAAIPSR